MARNINVQPMPLYKRPLSKSPPIAPIAKKQKLEQDSSSKVEEYSSSQTPICIDDEDTLREKLRRIGGQRDVLITATKVEKGAPAEPPMTLLALTIEDFKGKEIDHVVE